MTKSFLLLYCLFITSSCNALSDSEKMAQNKWDPLLQEAKGKTYFQSLGLLVQKIAAKLREANHGQRLDIAEYGKVAEIKDEQCQLEQTTINHALLVNRYMTEIQTKKIPLSVEELANLNIIFAASTSSYREIFQKNLADIAKLNIRNWLISFRTESPCVEFRLFPLMEEILKKGDGEVTRELVWLSKYHQDFKIRSLAVSALEEQVIKRYR